jgi:hypothetical protein
MLTECNYSFTDLYIAAFGRTPSEEELLNFGKISQFERNILVKQWAEKAGWEVKDKIGTDGQVYTAFAPEFSSTNNK